VSFQRNVKFFMNKVADFKIAHDNLRFLEYTTVSVACAHGASVYSNVNMYSIPDTNFVLFLWLKRH
jgi:hypothetical protein